MLNVLLHVGMKFGKIDSVAVIRISEIVRRKIEMADKRKVEERNETRTKIVLIDLPTPISLSSSIRGRIAFPSFDLVKRKNNKRFHLSQPPYLMEREGVPVSSQA